MTTFTRTLPGLIAENHFRKHEICVYIEGKTDYPFYDEIFTTDENLSKFSYLIQHLGGKEEGKKEEKCRKLAAELAGNSHRYVVILDGHYDILKSSSFQNDQVVRLSRHSFENYLFHEQPIKQFCVDNIDRATVNIENYSNKLTTDFSGFLEKTKEKFMDLLVLDIAHQSAGTSKDVLPGKPYKFFVGGGVDFDEKRIQSSLEKAKNGIANKTVADTKQVVEEFLKEHRFIDLLPGHFAFGIIRRFILNMLRQGRTADKSPRDNHIQTALSRAVWGLVDTKDHRRLKKQLHAAVMAVNRRL